MFLRPPAFPQQDDAYRRMAHKKFFALYSDLGTGKSYMLLREFLVLWMIGKVDGLLIVAPSDVHRQWVEQELPKTTDQECVTAVWPEHPSFLSSELPRIFTVYPEAFRRKPRPPPRLKRESNAAFRKRRKEWRSHQKNVLKIMEKFLKSGRMGIIIDECQMIMHYKSNTARAIRSLRDLAVYRRIASGYPAPGGRLELYYPQMNFLSPGILKCATFGDFKSRYCLSGGFRGKAIEGYQNEEEFKGRVAPWTYTVEIQDCIGMPERTWLEQSVELTSQQEKIIKQIKTEFLVELEKKTLFMPMVLQRLIRTQQATCGFLPYDVNENAEGRPDIRLQWIPELRTKALENLVDRIRGKIVIWSTFTPCIERLVKHLSPEAVKYRGGMTREERLDSKERFIRDPKIRFMVAQPRSAGTGIDGLQLNCRYSIYWSQSYDSQHRRQTERRIWRLGQSKSCVYLDMLAPGTYDSRIRQVVMNGQKLTDSLHKDLAAWRKG